MIDKSNLKNIKIKNSSEDMNVSENKIIDIKESEDGLASKSSKVKSQDETLKDKEIVQNKQANDSNPSKDSSNEKKDMPKCPRIKYDNYGFRR